MASMAAPPLPPDVVRQQMPPAMQFMQNAGAASQNAMQSFNGLAMAKERLQQIVALLKDVADVIVIERPALVKHLQIMAQAGSAIMSEIEANQPSEAPQAQMPNPQDAAGAVSMS